MRGLSILFGCLIAGSATAKTYLVGDTQFDGCDLPISNIQDAIDAAQANGFYGNKILVTNSGSQDRDQSTRFGISDKFKYLILKSAL
jgi:hypothetical protein